MQFQKSILYKDNADNSFIKSTYPDERLNIYRQTIFENMRNALKITFPGVWILLGDECANGVAYAFCQENLPSSGCLDDFGEDFSVFVAKIKELSSLPYIKDYAEFEWLKNQAYMAKHSELISPAALSEIKPELIDQIKFIFIDSAITYQSNFSIDKIEEIIYTPESDQINLIDKKVYAIIAIPKTEITIFWIEEDLYHFIEFLIEGLNLSQTTEKMEKLYPSFDLSMAIHFLLEKQLITKIII